MKKKLYFVIASVLFISIILLSISYAKESKYENMYHSKFINYRDTEILKYFLENKSYWI